MVLISLNVLYTWLTRTYRGFFSNRSVILLTSPVKESRNSLTSVDIFSIYPPGLLYALAACLSEILLCVGGEFECVREVPSTSVSLVDKDLPSCLRGRCRVPLLISLLIAGVRIRFVDGGLQVIVMVVWRGERGAPLYVWERFASIINRRSGSGGESGSGCPEIDGRWDPCLPHHPE
jgi:hypothetical protein